MGDLWAFLLLQYYRNCKIENVDLIYMFSTLWEILTGLLILNTYLKIEPFRHDYDPFLVGQAQIRMYEIPLCIHII